MRTTVNIDDDVLAELRKRAAAEGRPIGRLVTEALRERLARRASPAHSRYRAVVSGDGGTLPGVDLTNNAAVRDLMDGQ